MALIFETNFPNILYRGKVRDTYALEDGLLLMISTDRVSAFDVIFPTGIPGKGVILSKLSKFWFDLTSGIIDNHFINLAKDVKNLSTIMNPDLYKALSEEELSRAMVVKKAERIDVECICRGHITGSAWEEYVRTGSVFGSKMPTGMKEGDLFSEPLFTPTTKAEEGHDEPITIEQMQDMIGKDLTEELRQKTIEVYSFARDYAQKRGVIIADTKMEFGILDNKVILIDELLTPDSSRFWDGTLFELGKSITNFDKQFIRDWVKDTGWNKEPPAPNIPDNIISKTLVRYEEALNRLTN